MNKPVKILSLVSYRFLPPAMGGQKGIALFNRYLSRHANLTCVTIKANTLTRSEPYPIRNILSNSAARYINPFYFFTLKGIIKKEKITHLLLEHPYYGWLGILLKWSCGVKLVVHSHNIESLRFKSMGKWWWGILWQYEKLTHGKADHSFFIQDADREYAIRNFKLDPKLCSTITYGFESGDAPADEEKHAAREMVCKLHSIPAGERILLFNGTLGYRPNLEALDCILERINPILMDAGFKYRIVVCGSRLPDSYNGLAGYTGKNITYAGFVDDIDLYFKGCDILINPVIEGGGIKTKVVEALGCNQSVISTASGAVGIPQDITGGKLQVVADHDWKGFASAVISCDPNKKIPRAYFDHFYWDRIAARAAAAISAPAG